jgi:hypothetical protein
MDEEFIERANNLKDVIRDTPYDLLQQRVYMCFANGCLLLTSFLKSKGEKGWSSKLIDDSGQHMLTKSEQQTLEDTFEKAPWLWTMLSTVGKNGKEEQTGGALPLPQIAASGSLAEKIPGLSSINLTGDDVSLDKLFKKFLDYTNKLDDFWTNFQNGPGAGVKTFMEGDQIVTIPMSPPIPVPVPRKPIVMLLVALIDSFRLSSSLMGNKNSLLTLLILLEELATGQWRQMIMTAVGLISPAGVAIGVVGKYIINAWMLINPTLRDDLLRDVYKGGKSFLIGFLLWAASILPPQAIRLPIEKALEQLKTLVSGLDDKIKAIEEEGSKALKPVGKQLKLGRVNLDALTKISLADIQNLQALAQWDLIMCTQEFQEIIGAIEKEPIFRLLLELLSVPTLPEDKYKVCGAEPYLSVADRVKEVMTPQIIDADQEAEEPTSGGGKRNNRRSSRKRKSRKLRKSYST